MEKPTNEEIEANPDRYIRFKTGAVYDREVGHIVANPGGGTAAITPATSQLMHERKRQLSAEAAVQGLVDGANALNKGVTDGYGAWRAIVAHVAKTLMGSDNLRGQGEVLGKLAQVTGFNQPETAVEKPNLLEQAGIIALAAELASKMVANERDVVDAETKEMEE